MTRAEDIARYEERFAREVIPSYEAGVQALESSP
jgi:hypothetical protein